MLAEGIHVEGLCQKHEFLDKETFPLRGRQDFLEEAPKARCNKRIDHAKEATSRAIVFHQGQGQG